MHIMEKIEFINKTNLEGGGRLYERTNLEGRRTYDRTKSLIFFNFDKQNLYGLPIYLFWGGGAKKSENHF